MAVPEIFHSRICWPVYQYDISTSDMAAAWHPPLELVQYVYQLFLKNIIRYDFHK